jgi:hypothetical protein
MYRTYNPDYLNQISQPHCVYSLLLIVANGAHRLFAHGALVSISRTLIVVRVGNEAGNDAKQSKWLNLDYIMNRTIGKDNENLEMSCLWYNLVFVNGYPCVVHLIDIQKFDATFCDQIVKRLYALFHVLIRRLTVLVTSKANCWKPRSWIG